MRNDSIMVFFLNPFFKCKISHKIAVNFLMKVHQKNTVLINFSITSSPAREGFSRFMIILHIRIKLKPSSVQ